MRYFRRFSLFLLCAFLLTSASWSQVPFDSKGPAKVTLGSNMATLDLPAGYLYLGKDKTHALLTKWGSHPDNEDIGMVLPSGKEEWAILFTYEDKGYVKDDDADKLKPDEILDSLKKGTEAQNEERQKNGMPELHVTGWDEAPHYDKARHTVIWSVEGRSGDEQIVNFNNRMLARKGVLSVNLMCSKKDLAGYKPNSTKILNAVAFSSGERYEDYKEGDKVSAGGIAALILGGLVLKKAGILAFLLGLFKPLLLFAKKGIILIVIGLSALWKKITGKSSDSSNPPGGSPPVV